jgi:tRNA pseudouridine38-40 synthase
MNYVAKIKYLGTNFCGFQVQPDKRTVQGELCRALSEALCVDCKVTGCSRTDAGVHANSFTIKIDAEGATVPAERLPLAVSKFLPQDLSLFWANECDSSFHPRYDVRTKEYLYRIINERVYDPFEYGRAWFLPKPITDLDVERMNEAADYLVGEHDFSAFMSEGSDVKNTVREIKHIHVKKTNSLIEVRVLGNGFLYNMVRIIVGTLIEVAYSRMTPIEVGKALISKDRKSAGMTAPAEGLYLNSVNY